MNDELDFFAALRAIWSGRRATKTEWGDTAYWAQMYGGQLVLHKPDGQYYPWIISDGDMAGEDWQLLTYA